MSADSDIQRARQLIADECYEDAEAILRKSTEPGAHEWLMRLVALYFLWRFRTRMLESLFFL